MSATTTQHQNGQRPVVIGTAGHVDHGKSTLVRALTGIDPDRLAEEKARSMTIDLGFAWFDLPGGRSASIVDVPGHEHFIKNMLAGIGGIDVALLVVASDEGPMPQTREHLAIIDLLGIEQGVVALTKADQSEPDLIDYVAEEVRELIRDSSLAGAPVVPVSAMTGAGLSDLRDALGLAAQQPTHSAFGPARLPIDRVFTVTGFGTVVTGTMLGGSIAPGDDLVVMPAGSRVRVRGTQSHNRPVERVEGGMRAAINISGAGDQNVRRGDVLSRPGALTATHRVDVQLRLLPESPVTLGQNARVDIFTGATESAAQLTLLERDSLEPGESQIVQIRVAKAIAVAAGDRFIVRQASPSATIGGGVVLDAAPRRHRRFDPVVLERLNGLVHGDVSTVIRNVAGSSLIRRDHLGAALPESLPESDVANTIQKLIDTGEFVVVEGSGSGARDWLISRDAWEGLVRQALDSLSRYHERHPLRPGMPQEDLRTATRLDARAFDVLLAALEGQQRIIRNGSLVRAPDFAITFDEPTTQRVDRFLAALTLHPVDPPGPQEFGIDSDVLAALDAQGHIVRLSDSMAFESGAFDRLAALTIDHLEQHGTITLAEFRDRVGTSRKYAQAVLEEFDRRRLTRRAGDIRHRGSAAWPVVRK